jgi:hypothetical protein
VIQPNLVLEMVVRQYADEYWFPGFADAPKCSNVQLVGCQSMVEAVQKSLIEKRLSDLVDEMTVQGQRRWVSQKRGVDPSSSTEKEIELHLEDERTGLELKQ